MTSKGSQIFQCREPEKKSYLMILTMDLEHDESELPTKFELDEWTLAKPQKLSWDFELDPRTLAKLRKLSSDFELDQRLNMTNKNY